MKVATIPIIFIFLVLTGCAKEETIQEKGVLIMKENTLSNITIIDVYDNVEFDPSFKTGFGFGCIIKLPEKTILFDTGSDAPTLLSNLETAGINPSKIDIVVLSHIHDDHTGGLLGLLEINSNVKVYVPSSFPSSFKNEIEATGAEVINVINSIKITDGIYSTGELGTWIKEQSLVITSDKGLIIVTGCAHPGIVNIVRKAKELFDKKVYLVLGGFHLSSVANSELIKIVSSFKELEVEKIAPSHCTGDSARGLFKQEYKNDFIESGVGKIIEI